jgi:hypothetical protein
MESRPLAVYRDGAVMGIAATLTMDLSNVIWTQLGIRGVDPLLFGKWVDAVLHGRLASDDLMGAPRSTLSPVVGLVIHYLIGIALATAFVFLLRRIQRPVVHPVLAGVTFGVATTVFAWLFMFPSMGFGVFGARPPAGYSLFTSSLVRHASYGFGLGLAARYWLLRERFR